MPRSSEASTPTLSVTEAYQTVSARLTQAIALTPSGTIAPTSTTNGTPSESPTTVVATDTPAISSPTNTATLSTSCDRAAPGDPIDVTVPDDTQMQPGEPFIKTWRLQNSGTCTWTQNYSIALFSGNAMGAPASVPMPASVPPGQSVDISVDMVAPQETGTHQGYWKLRNASNTWFGIGPNGDSAFWVRIVVGQTSTVTPTLPTATATMTTTPSTPGPQPSETVTSTIKASGQALLSPQDKIDLDNNQVNSGGSDLSYEVNTEDQLVLKPMGNAAIGIFGNTRPFASDCLSTNLGGSPILLQDLRQGMYLCYRTDQGSPGWMVMVDYNSSSHLLSTEILTWALP